MVMSLLEVKDVVKRYGDREALAGVSLTVQQGQTLGLLGPNGAGKSTLVSTICGLIRADSGDVFLSGAPMRSASMEHKRRIGLVPQDLALYEDLTAYENLRLFGGLYGLTGKGLQDRIHAALELVSLSDRAKDNPSDFSGGMKRRLNIAAAMLHNPDLLILDEPTVGVDPQSRNAIFDALEVLKDQGKSLIYTSHYMEEVERLADHLVIIDHGKVLADSAPSDLYKRLPAQAALSFELAQELSAEQQQQLLAKAGVSSLTLHDDRMSGSIHLRDQTEAFECLQLLRQQGHQLLHFATAKAKLEEVFLALTGRSLRD